MYNYYYPQQQSVMSSMMGGGNQGYMQTVPQPMTLKGRPVSSIDEVRAAQIDFDGSVFLFPDMANKKIYTKQINLDGTASLNCYALQDLTQPQTQPSPQYVTKEEFDAVVAKLTSQLEEKSKTTAPAINF